MRFEGFGPGVSANPLRPRLRPAISPLEEVSFQPNPGNLRMFQYLPPGLKPGAPLVVVLHGCGQTAAGYAAATGWDVLAERHGFALLAAEQKAVNNPNTCFDWFLPDDIARERGEAASIAAMVHTLLDAHALDAGRVFVTGLSAGGAMTAAMLASYPELFAGGAIVAGLPFGAAANVRDALETMRNAPLKTPREWGDKVRAASAHRGPWPRVSIWHGDQDTTVNINNAQASAAQWADLQGLALADAKEERIGGAVRLSWGDRLEVYTVAGLGHGTPIDSRDVGMAAPYVLEAGISSSRRIAAFWGLIAPAKATPVREPVRVIVPPPPALPQIEAALEADIHADVRAPAHETLIRRALRAAGLLRRPR